MSGALQLAQAEVDTRRHRLDAHRDGAGPDDDPGARPLLRGPRAREEHAEHVHDVHRRARVADVLWALVGYSLAFDGGNGFIGGFGHAFLNDVALRPARRARRSRTCSSWSSRGPSASSPSRWSPARWSSGCASCRSSSSPALWSLLVYAVLAHWSFGGGWLSEQRDARLRRRRAGRDGLRASRRLPPRWSSARARTTGARRCCRTTRSSSCSARACCGSAGSASTAAAASRPATSGVLAFTNTLLTPGVHAGRLVHARPDPRPPGDGDRRRHGDHRRLRRDHARAAGFISPGWAMVARRARGDPELPGDRLAAAHPRRRDARRARRPRHRRPHRDPVHRASSPRSTGTGSSDGLFYGNAEQLGWQAIAVAGHADLRVRR